MASEDARYRQSSQYRLWSFSPSQLAGMREKTNALARTSIAERLSASGGGGSSSPGNNNNNNVPISNQTSSANTPDPNDINSAVGTPNASGGNGLPEFLTPAEELIGVQYYTSELLRAAEFAEMALEIKATAAAFFRRFYVTNSIMTYPPTDMLIVALFFGCKAEGHFQNVAQFAAKFGGEQKPDTILAGEFLLCQGIRFAIDVRHPFRALQAATMQLLRLGVDEERVQQAEHRATEILGFSPLITDAYFHYTPSQIMLAALSLADRGLAERLIQETFHYVAGPGNNGGTDTPMGGASGGVNAKDLTAELIGSQVRDKLLGAVEACRDMLSKELPERKEHWMSKPFRKAHITPMRKKLVKCCDPDRWNLVELQRSRRERALKKGDSEDGDPDSRMAGMDDDAAVFGSDARDHKRRKVTKQEDPFGGALMR